MTPSTLPEDRPALLWGRMPRKHVFMLALAVEILVMGWRWSERYRPPGITVEVTVTEGHEIT